MLIPHNKAIQLCIYNLSGHLYNKYVTARREGHSPPGPPSAYAYAYTYTFVLRQITLYDFIMVIIFRRQRDYKD